MPNPQTAITPVTFSVVTSPSPKLLPESHLRRQLFGSMVRRIEALAASKAAEKEQCWNTLR